MIGSFKDISIAPTLRRHDIVAPAVVPNGPCPDNKCEPSMKRTDQTLFVASRCHIYITVSLLLLLGKHPALVSEHRLELLRA